MQWRSAFVSRNLSLWSLSQSKLSNIGRLFLSRDVLAYFGFGRFRIISKSDYWLRYVCPSFRLTAWNKSADIWVFFSKNCREYSSFIKIWQELRVFYVAINILFNHISMNSSQNEQFFRQIFRKHQNTRFDILLTVHLSIFILAIKQLDAQNLFYNKFISCLYIFRAPCAHRQEVKIVLYSVWYHYTYRWLSHAQVESSLNLCSGRPPIGVMIPEAV